jgi:hypothetical protein
MKLKTLPVRHPLRRDRYGEIALARPMQQEGRDRYFPGT